MADFTKEQQDAIDAAVAAKVEEETRGLKANRDELAKEAKAAKARLANYDGIDPEEHKRLKAAAEEADRKKAAAEGDFTKLRDQMVEKHNTELSVKDKRIQKFESALSRRLTTDELRKALTGKALPEYQDLLVEHGAKYLKVQETEDDFEYVIHDGKGNALVADGKGSPMTIDQFVDQTLKSKYPGAFVGSGSSGGGATKSTGGAGGKRTISASDGAAFVKYAKEIANGEVEVV